MPTNLTQPDQGIHKDGTTTTIAEIPFSAGTRLYENETFDSSATGKGVMLTEATQGVFYDDGSNFAQIYPYYSGSSGGWWNTVGKCLITVDAVDNMSFNSSSSEFKQPSTFNQTAFITGRAYLNPGTSGVFRGIGAVLAYSTTQTASSTGGAVDAWSVTIAGNTLDTNGDSLTMTFSVHAANTANNKRFRVQFDGTTIGDSTSIAAQNGDGNVTVELVRQSATTVYCYASCQSTTKWINFTTYTSVSVANLTGSRILKVLFDTAIANSDTVFNVGKLRWEPAP